MKTKTNVWSCIFALAAGVLLLIFNDRNTLFSTIVQIIGVMMTIPSAIGVISSISSTLKPGNRKQTGWATAAGSALGLIFGVCLISMPRVFASAIIYTLAGIMIVAAVIGIAALVSSRLSGPSGVIFYIVPALMIITGVAVIIIGQPHLIDRTAALITGIGLIVYSLNGFVAMIGDNRIGKAINRNNRSAVTKDIW